MFPLGAPAAYCLSLFLPVPVTHWSPAPKPWTLQESVKSMECHILSWFDACLICAKPKFKYNTLVLVSGTVKCNDCVAMSCLLFQVRRILLPFHSSSLHLGCAKQNLVATATLMNSMRLPLCNKTEEPKHCHFSCHLSDSPAHLCGCITYLELSTHTRKFRVKFWPGLGPQPQLSTSYLGKVPKTIYRTPKGRSKSNSSFLG